MARTGDRMTMTEPTSPYAQAADLYWRAGWHGILPLPIKAKKNPPAGFTGSGGKYPSYPDITVWIEDHAGGNIALRMPPNVIGLDVDAYGDKDGHRTLTLAEAKHGPLPATWRTTSRDDGISGIRLYRVPEGLAWPGELGPGTEIIQRNHRYALVWPSIHPEGRTYRWISPDGVVSTHIPDPDDLPHLPEEWVANVTGGVQAEEVARNQMRYDEAMAWIAGHENALANPCARMVKVIDHARIEIGNGSAHNPARDTSLRIVRLTDEEHRGGIKALVEARGAFIKDATDPNRVLLGKTRRTDSEAAYEWGELVASAVGLVTANPTGMSTCDCDGQLTGAILGAATATDPVPLEKPTSTTEPASDEPQSLLQAKLRNGEEFILNIPEKVPTIWGNNEDALWIEGEALMIAGPPGVGKTTLTGQVLRGLLGLQQTVLGHDIEPATKILYLAMDRPAQIRRALGRAFHRNEADILRTKIEFWEGPPPGDFAKHPDVLTALAQLAGATHVIIDSLKDAAVGLSEDDVGAAYNRARQTALAAGVQVLELHHMVKRGAGGNKPTELADVYGSAWLTAGVGSVVLLWGAAGDPIVDFRHLKQPVGEVGPYRLQHDHTTGTTTIFHGTDILAIATGAGAAGVTAKAIACQTYETDKPSSAQREKTRRKLEKLVTQGHLTKHDNPSDAYSAGKSETVYKAVLDGGDVNHGQITRPSNTDPHTVNHEPSRETQTRRSANHDLNHANHAQGQITPTPPLIGGGGVDHPKTDPGTVACNKCGDDTPITTADMTHGLCLECAP
jgi:DNA polymerase III delta prime subunit